MFFTVPEDAHWNAERQAVEFGVEVGEYRGRGQGPAARRWLSPFGPGKLLPLRVWDGFASRREARSPNWECVSAPRRDPTNQHRKILSCLADLPLVRGPDRRRLGPHPPGK